MNKESLEYFRSLLLKRRTELIEGAKKSCGKELRVKQEELADSMDHSCVEADRNFTLRLRDRQRKLLKKIDEALNRIDEGTFGICQECGKPIGEKRLKVRPVATLCISCKEKQEEYESLRS